MAKEVLSLSEQLLELSNPRPVEFHPDEDDWALLSAAEVNRHSRVDIDGAGEKKGGVATRASSRGKRLRLLETEYETRYAGKSVSRRELEDYEQEG